MRQATFVASKVSSDVYGVDTKCSHLAEGRFKSLWSVKADPIGSVLRRAARGCRPCPG